MGSNSNTRDYDSIDKEFEISCRCLDKENEDSLALRTWAKPCENVQHFVLSHSHEFRVAVFDWQVFEFEPSGSSLPKTQSFIDKKILAAVCSILCSMQSADENQPG